MNKLKSILILIAALATSACSTANAASVEARVTGVERLMETVTGTSYREVCQNIQVPIYETRRSTRSGSTGDVLTGAIIGGAIGNQFGDGKGKDAMTVLGAIVGADTATRRTDTYQVQTGSRTQRECYQEPFNTTRRVPTGYLVRYEWNGLYGDFVTNHPYRTGDTVIVTVNVTLN
jgi:uncharacterized protein YcfJ